MKTLLSRCPQCKTYNRVTIIAEFIFPLDSCEHFMGIFGDRSKFAFEIKGKIENVAVIDKDKE